MQMRGIYELTRTAGDLWMALVHGVYMYPLPADFDSFTRAAMEIVAKLPDEPATATRRLIAMVSLDQNISQAAVINMPLSDFVSALERLHV